MVSPVGFGGYRVRVESALHRRALADALRGGVNLIDTSTNYADGASESLVGNVLGNLVQQGELEREQVVVVSKVGTIQGQNLERVRACAAAYPELVRYRDDLWHCLHPDFIADQLEESLQRLGLEQLDVLLLHNPEYFLLDSAAQPRADADASALRETYDDRLLRAFARLEELVAQGKIRWYGVSSNAFVEPASASSFTSIARMLGLARRAGGEAHHFAVVQMPMNLLELGAMRCPQPAGQRERTPLEMAHEADLGVMINRPLDAFARGEDSPRLVRLVDAPETLGVSTPRVRDALLRVRKLEGQWASGLGKQLVTADGRDDAVDLFRWGQEIAARLTEIRDLEHWQRLRHEVLAPQLGRTSAALLEVLEGATREAFATWWTQYGAALHHAFEAIERSLASKRGALVQAIAAALDEHVPESWRTLPLSRKAVLTLLGAPVSTVLVGMRHPAYVVDMLALRDPLAAAMPSVPFSRIEDAMQVALGASGAG